MESAVADRDRLLLPPVAEAEARVERGEVEMLAESVAQPVRVAAPPARPAVGVMEPLPLGEGSCVAEAALLTLGEAVPCAKEPLSAGEGEVLAEVQPVAARGEEVGRLPVSVPSGEAVPAAVPEWVAVAAPLPVAPSALAVAASSPVALPTPVPLPPTSSVRVTLAEGRELAVTAWLAAAVWEALQLAPPLPVPRAELLPLAFTLPLPPCTCEPVPRALPVGPCPVAVAVG